MHTICTTGLQCRRGILLFAAAIVITAVGWPGLASAQSGTWTAGTGLWSGSSNWSGGVIADGSGNTARFTTTGTTTLDTNRTIGTIAVTVAGIRAIEGAVATLTLASGAGTPTLTGTTGSTLGIGTVIDGTQGFLKTGTSTLVLTGANIFSGSAVIQTGTAIIQNLTALGASGAGNHTVVANGAQLRITGGVSGVIAESFALSGRGNPTNAAVGSGGAIRVQSSVVTLAGGIVISGSSTELFPDSNSSLTITGDVTGTGGFILRNTVTVTGNMSHDGWFNRWSGGTGVVTLSGSNSYTGSTAIDSGPAMLNNAFALPVTTALTVSGATGLLDLNGYDTTIRTFAWRTDGVNPPSQYTSSGGVITDNSTTPGTTTITVTSGSFALGTAINDGSSGRKVALSVAAGGGANLANIELNNASSTFSGGLTLLNGADRGTRLDIKSPLVNSGSPGAITSSILGTGTVTVGLAPTDKAQFHMLPDTYAEGIGSTVLNDFVFNTAVGADTTGGVLLNTREATFAGTLVAGQASITIARGAVQSGTAHVAVLTGRVTSTGANGGLRLFGNGQVPGIEVRLANATASPNDYQGPTTVDASTTLILGAADQVPNGVGKSDVSVAGNFNLGGFNETINGLTGSGIVDGGSLAPILTVGDSDATASFGGVIRNSAGVLSLTKIGAGVQTLAGANSYSGPTTVAGGTLLVNGDQSSATGAVAVASGATLGGVGTVGGATTIESGATLSPGASPGTLTFSQGLTLAAGGNYNWQVYDAAGTAGSATSWDLVSVGGVLDIASTAESPFSINLWSLSSTGPDVNGNALNFSSTTSGTWRIASVAGGITNFAADKFQIITGATNGTGGFANAFTGTFSLAQSGNDLNLVYTASAPTVITINVPSGTETQTAAGHPFLAGTTPVVKIGAGTVVFDQPNTLTGPTTVTQGTLELATADTLSSSAVTVAAGATLSVAPQVSAVVPALVNNGLVNVGLGEFTVVGGLTAEGLKAEIVAGRNEGGWDGATGITSSAAAGMADRAVGWIDNGDGSFRFGFAAAGDLDMNGLVDLDDVIAFVGGGLYDTGSPAVWAQGDYDYNGIVDLDDVIAFVGGGLYDKGPYNQPEGGMSLMAFGDDPGLMNGGFAAVPEPSTWVLATIGVGVAASSLRRRAAGRTPRPAHVRC